MNARTAAVGVLCTAALLCSCAGTGEVVPLDLHARLAVDQQVQPSASSGPEPPLKVVIRPFEDGRSEKGGLGRRTHLWGGETYFDVAKGQPGEVMARALAEFLHERGWTATVSPAASTGGATVETAPDVIITGQLADLSANAKSRVFSTKMTVGLKLTLQASNADGSTARLTVSGARTDSEMWFEPEVLAALVDDVLYDSFQKLLAGTKVQGRRLELR